MNLTMLLLANDPIQKLVNHRRVTRLAREGSSSEKGPELRFFVPTSAQIPKPCLSDVSYYNITYTQQKESERRQLCALG